MTARDKATLKSYFETNDTPTEAQFADLIDTFFGTWTPYHDTSTVVGWTSFIEKLIHYKTVGNLVYVNFALDGTSNATTTTFTLPETVATVSALQIMIQVKDNGTYAVGMLTIAHEGTTVNFYTDEAASAWTNSGAKGVFGQFWYEKA